MAKIYYYILLTRQGNPLVKDCKLLIYWNKNIAIQEAIKFSAYPKKIKITDLKRIYCEAATQN